MLITFETGEVLFDFRFQLFGFDDVDLFAFDVDFMDGGKDKSFHIFALVALLLEIFAKQRSPDDALHH